MAKPPKQQPAPTGSPTLAEIEDFAKNQASFGLEMQVLEALRHRDIPAAHGGRYRDPIEGKPRQFDVRADYVEKSIRQVRFGFAVECKCFSEEFPMVVFEVERRPVEDRVFAIVWDRRHGLADVREFGCTTLYGSGSGKWVGKSADNFRRRPPGTKSDPKIEQEVYAKWTQAISSAHAMAKEFNAAPGAACANFYFPVLVVPDSRLFVARYRSNGECASVESATCSTIYLDESAEFIGPNLGQRISFRMSHLHVYTLAGFKEMLNAFMRGNDPWSHLTGRALL